MTDNFNTATMAKLYADQGHYDKAIQIYRVLLEKDPDRKDLLNALADIEAKNAASRPGSEQRLGELIGQWIELVVRYNRLQHLKKIKKNLC